MSLDAAIQHIELIDFSMIKSNMVDRSGWSPAEVDEAIRLYRNYLILRVKYPDENLPPSDDVDEVWHNHILDTKKYRFDCNVIFGSYFDHYPYFGRDERTTQKDLDEAFARAQELHRAEFGYAIARVRLPRFLRWLKRFMD